MKTSIITSSPSTASPFRTLARRFFMVRVAGAVPSKFRAHDQDFYALKNVPHGQLREVHCYFSKVANATLQSFVYTPPDYEKSTKRYPVLYLQHGAGEDEHGWGGQGFAGLIMDNLIGRKAKRSRSLS